MDDQQQQQAIKELSSAFTLATAVLASAKAYEESFDKVEAAKGHKIVEAGGIFDFNKCYQMSLHEACRQNGRALCQPAYLLLQNSWNDALEWATYITAQG